MAKWVLIADSAKATIVEYNGLKEPLKVLPAGNWSLVAKSARDVTSTRRGRVFNSADNRRAAMERPTDPLDIEKTKFASQLADYLKECMADYHALIIIAAPKALGELRQQLADCVKEKVQQEVAKDLTNIPVNDLAGHLQEVLPINEKHRVLVV